MNLTDEQKQKFQKVISNGKCPFCGGTEFSTAKEGEIQNLVAAEDIQESKFATIPVYLMACTKCGHYSFFNLKVIENL